LRNLGWGIKLASDHKKEACKQFVGTLKSEVVREDTDGKGILSNVRETLEAE
jgi:hypothetical protein